MNPNRIDRRRFNSAIAVGRRDVDRPGAKRRCGHRNRSR